MAVYLYARGPKLGDPTCCPLVRFSILFAGLRGSSLRLTTKPGDPRQASLRELLQGSIAGRVSPRQSFTYDQVLTHASRAKGSGQSKLELAGDARRRAMHQRITGDAARVHGAARTKR